MNNGSPSSATAVNGREPFASTAAGSTWATGRPAEPSAAAISAGADAPVGHAEQDERTGADRYPGGERQDHFHRRGRAGDQPRNGGQPQCGPGGAPPRTAEPRRGGDRAGHGGGKKRGAHQRRAGKPRPLAGAGRQSTWTLPARQHERSRPARRLPIRRRPPGWPAAGTGGNATSQLPRRRPRRRRPPAPARPAPGPPRWKAQQQSQQQRWHPHTWHG